MKTLLCSSLAIAFLLAVPPLGAAGDARRDLVGRVVRGDQAPVPNATVFVYTAGPRTGTGVVCPSCYPDCGKRARTDANGAFRIPALDPGLLFRLLIVAEGYESIYVPKTDPAAGEQTVVIAPLDAAKLKAPTRICGLVLNPDGEVVPGATVSPEGVARGGGTQWGGTDAFVDPLAVTDEHGRFWLYCTNGVDLVHALVEGRGLAKRWVELRPGRDHLIRMEEGVLVTGMVESGGEPLSDVLVGVVTADRTCGNFFRGDELATDKDGFFALPNVPADREWVLYTTMHSLRGRGAMAPRIFRTGKDGGVVKLGELAVTPGHRLAGRVVLSDGQPIPPETRMFLGREQAWDHTEVVLGADGRFEFTDVPAESVGLSVRIRGYQFSKRNPSLDWLNGGIVGRIAQDVTDLTLLMEPGEWRYDRGEDGPSGEDRQPREKPLRGVKLE